MAKKVHALCIIAMAVSGAVSAQGVAVNAIEAQLTSVNPTRNYVAKFEPQAHTQITPRVTGYIVKQKAEDGALVAKGDVLFKLDDTIYRHNHNLAQANVNQAKAGHRSAELHYDRVVQLQGPGGSTQSDLELAQSQLDSAKAALSAAEVNVEKAAYDLASTVVVAPYDGKLGKARFSEGDLVSPATGALTDIVQLSPMNVTFNMDYNAYKAYGLNNPESQSVRLRDTNTPTQVNYVANKVNPTAGTIQISASFDNSEYDFKPHKVTHVTVEHAEPQQGFWIPESALVQDLTIQYVYVINEHNSTALRRDIKITQRDQGRVFVTEGIEDGNQVITDGLMRVRPNAFVHVQKEK
ncbi:efflux RND transporter periplasmic adaptor subunit [Photobacterium sanctipauli]|uniref:Efflux RND transporter periplasmic adaptor subunit n=1 Tax=Photobacterium sanctipauli TaxID=1342794 RepID=A0A2T3NZW1_9GAMM|nr:efflux RND transporter periplasmic adaptor subunit [Photobacterium sanctipauli]PSW21748.1 efflux RND transporter periplasmic adaptor subunit [Photobacterium sanctipauli]